MADKKISELDEALTINNDAVFPYSQENGGDDTSFKAPITQLGAKIAEGLTFSNLTTQAKTLVGAINEAASGSYKEVSGTLTAGSTSITLSDASITETSFIQVFAGNGNINYTSISATTGSVTIGFLAQASDMTVTVRIS